jgi:hypothetical protein
MGPVNLRIIELRFTRKWNFVCWNSNIIYIYEYRDLIV